MKVLLIGKTGQLGRALEHTLARAGCEVAAPARGGLDVTVKEAVHHAVQSLAPDIIVNCSAFNLVKEAEDEPRRAMELNCCAVREIARAARDRGTTFVTYSSDYVFDGEKGSPYTEDDAPNPVQVYGMTKLAGECAALSSNPERTYVIRTNGVFGGGRLGSPGKKGNFVLSRLKDGEKGSVEVSSEQVANPTYAEHLANATVALVDAKARPGIYHLASEGYASWAEIAREIYRIWGVNARVHPVDRGGMDGTMRRPRMSVLANGKARKLGIVLPAWQEGLEAYYAALLHE